MYIRCHVSVLMLYCGCASLLGGIYIYQNSQPQRNQGPVQAILTHETPTTTRRIPKQVEIDEAAEIQNIGNMYDCTWH